jgi:hypothetical protein
MLIKCIFTYFREKQYKLNCSQISLLSSVIIIDDDVSEKKKYLRSTPYLEIFFGRGPKHVYCNFIEFRYFNIWLKIRQKKM